MQLIRRLPLLKVPSWEDIPNFPAPTLTFRYKMGVCSICLTATRTLGPHDWPRSRDSGLKSIKTLPKYCTGEGSTCWVCAKFAAWLEIEDAKAFAEWHTKSLVVEYVGWGRVGVEGMTQGEGLPPFLMRIIPPGHGREGGCPIELNFISYPGKRRLLLACLYVRVDDARQKLD